MDDSEASNLVAISQGIHIILDKEFLPGDSAIMVPQTNDGRVLFAVPWHNKVIVGTTDTATERAMLEPRALEEEIEFILHHTAKYMAKDPTRKDVKSVFAGLRPLVKPSNDKKTSAISRDHFISVSNSGLVTITGGKWTTYRRMGEDVVNKAALVAGLDNRASNTANLRIHGWLKNVDRSSHLYVYGSDIAGIEKLISFNPALNENIHPDLPYKKQK